jgi:NodT family efflux transporter outer membrane factor (OMF) lipoprotein
VRTRAIHLVSSALAILAGLSCRTEHSSAVADVQVPDGWTADADRSTAEPPQEWWRAFGDPALESLVERAVAQNLDVAIAVARVHEARGIHDIATGALYPQVDGGAGVSRTHFSENVPSGVGTQTVYRAGFDASWELDLFGSNRAAVAAAEAGVQSAEEGRRDALVSLLGEVARNYVELRGAQRQVILIGENVEAERGTLELTSSRFQAGLATDLDVARAETLVANTEALIPPLQAAAATSIHRLSVLLAEPPGSLLAELSESKPVPVAQGAVAELAAGVPADLLRRRPDIRRAERDLAQAAALSDQATADLYPKISLSGSLGLASTSTGNLFEAGSKTWELGASLFAPIFHGGALRANVRLQDARVDEAVARYRLTVLNAMAEVEDDLVSVARERERRQSLETAVSSSRRALDLANDLHLRGLIDFFQVLDAQRSNVLAESELARSETNLTADTVALYKALGGGWEGWEPKDEGSAAP